MDVLLKVLILYLTLVWPLSSQIKMNPFNKLSRCQCGGEKFQEKVDLLQGDVPPKGLQDQCKGFILTRPLRSSDGDTHTTVHTVTIRRYTTWSLGGGLWFMKFRRTSGSLCLFRKLELRDCENVPSFYSGYLVWGKEMNPLFCNVCVSKLRAVCRGNLKQNKTKGQVNPIRNNFEK